MFTTTMLLKKPNVPIGLLQQCVNIEGTTQASVLGEELNGKAFEMATVIGEAHPSGIMSPDISPTGQSAMQHVVSALQVLC
jgi:hypothetical protein